MSNWDTPFRVRVWSGSSRDYLGEGSMVGRTTVFCFAGPDSICSLTEAELRPDDSDIAEMEEEGFVLVELPDSPKIIMDDGTVKYGCQVWWERI